MADMFLKREEFIAWLMEVKGIDLESTGHQEERKLFEEFAEDYNTVTLPSKKFYNIKKWEAKQEKKAKEGKLKKKKSKPESSLIKLAVAEKSTFNDEAELFKQRMQERERQKQEKVYQSLSSMFDSKETVNILKEQLFDYETIVFCFRLRR